ncbi:MAG: DUF4160 domain-containing protein [Verrucomicrobiae bacterium]|nr:DUF4160 domain-containing protein [Verrucomicrobiae bacterium]
MIEIETGVVHEGWLPKTACYLVNTWRLSHQQELRENWERARQRFLLFPIAPLE